MDFERYPEWNPFITSISGEPKVGAKLKVTIKPTGSSGMSFSPTVLVADENREFRWFGKLLIRGLFDGDHSYLIEPVSENTVKFTHAETYKGILVPLFGGTLDGTDKGFALMNKALKDRAEKQNAK